MIVDVWHSRDRSRWPAIMRDKKPDRRNIALGLEGALAGLAWKHDSQIRDGPTVNLHGLEGRTVMTIRKVV